MSELQQEIQRFAEGAVRSFQARANGALDYSEDSLGVVDELLAEAALFREQLAESDVTSLVRYLGCYVLEVGRRAYGGEYLWHKENEEPVLAVGEPDTHIAIATWGKVRGRLNGDPADNIAFFFAGFAEQASLLPPGRRVLFI